MCTFVLSTSYNRGPRLANKAGLFYSPAKGAILPISGGLPLPSAKKRTARESGLVDSGKPAGRFLFAGNVKQSHHAHHRQAIRTADYPCPLSRTRRKDGRRTSSAVSAILPGPRKVGPCRGQNLPRIVTRVTPLFFSFSLTYGELFTVKIPVLCLTLTIG